MSVVSVPLSNLSSMVGLSPFSLAVHLVQLFDLLPPKCFPREQVVVFSMIGGEVLHAHFHDVIILLGGHRDVEVSPLTMLGQDRVVPTPPLPSLPIFSTVAPSSPHMDPGQGRAAARLLPPQPSSQPVPLSFLFCSMLCPLLLQFLSPLSISDVFHLDQKRLQTFSFLLPSLSSFLSSVVVLSCFSRLPC